MKLLFYHKQMRKQGPEWENRDGEEEKRIQAIIVVSFMWLMGGKYFSFCLATQDWGLQFDFST